MASRRSLFEKAPRSALPRYEKALRAAVAAGTYPRLDEPWGYSDMVIRHHLQHVDFDEHHESALLGLERDALSAGYNRALQTFLRVSAPRGIFAARGWKRLSLGGAPALAPMLRRELKDTHRSWTMNAPASVARFANLHRFSASDLVERMMRDDWPWRDAALARLRKRGVARPSPAQLGREMKAVETPVMLYARLPPGKVMEYGGDSESGPLMEAELHVKGCGPGCVTDAF